MPIFNKDYYDKDYFVTPGGKKCTLADGTVQSWSYANPDGDWHGTLPIIKSWKKVFEPKKMLDVGAGRGVFLGYAQRLGIDARGFDFSEFVVNEGRFNKCEPDRIIQHDATEKWPYKTGEFDFTICLDLMEHIYEEDIDFVINELYRTNSKHIFLQIAVSIDFEYSFKKGEDIPKDFEVYTLTGHVLMKHKDWWMKKLERFGWLFNQQKIDEFYLNVNPPITNDCAWKTNLLVVMEKYA